MSESSYVGLAFPVRQAPSGLRLERDVENVKQAVRLFLGTRVRERVRLPEYGWRGHELVFEQEDAVLVGLAKFYTIDGLRRWEPRAEVRAVTVDVDRVKRKVTVTVLIDIPTLNAFGQKVVRTLELKA